MYYLLYNKYMKNSIEALAILGEKVDIYKANKADLNIIDFSMKNATMYSDIVIGRVFKATYKSATGEDLIITSSNVSSILRLNKNTYHIITSSGSTYALKVK